MVIYGDFMELKGDFMVTQWTLMMFFFFFFRDLGNKKYMQSTRSFVEEQSNGVYHEDVLVQNLISPAHQDENPN